jgi:proteasome lid subunit RPN8/RPN11
MSEPGSRPEAERRHLDDPAETGRHLRLDAMVEAAVRRHGEETYPHECCGALVGMDGRVIATVPLPNTTEEGPRRRFLVRPSDYRVAEQSAAQLGGELVGFYHSHPDHPARPSQYDLDHAWPNFAYVIVSVAAGQAGDLTVWWLKDDRSIFIEGELHGDQNPDSDTAAALH